MKMTGAPLPKVSVTVLTYNHGKWLAACLESIITQETNFPFEVIVGDDASTDGITQEILRDYATRYPDIIIPVFREKNIKGTKNYLDVMTRARGKYIAYIDGDDMMLPGKLQKQADFLDSNTDCSFVVHNVITIDGSSGEIISKRYVKHFIKPKSDINFLCVKGCFFTHSSKMYRSSSIISQHRERRTIDLFFHFEQASRGKIGYLEETLGVYRRSLNTASDPLGPLAETAEVAYQDAFERACELGVTRAILERGRLNHNYSLALDFLKKGNIAGFVNKIELSKDNAEFASLKHRLCNWLKKYHAILKVVQTIKRKINF